MILFWFGFFSNERLFPPASTIDNFSVSTTFSLRSCKNILVLLPSADFFPAVLIKIFFFLCAYVGVFPSGIRVSETHMHVQEKLKVAVLSYVFAIGLVVTWGKLLNSLCLNSYDNSSLPNSVVKLGV